MPPHPTLATSNQEEFLSLASNCKKNHKKIVSKTALVTVVATALVWTSEGRRGSPGHHDNNDDNNEDVDSLSRRTITSCQTMSNATNTGTSEAEDKYIIVSNHYGTLRKHPAVQHMWV